MLILTSRDAGTSNATLLLSPLGMKIGSVGRSNMSRISCGCAGLDIVNWNFCDWNQSRYVVEINTLCNDIENCVLHTSFKEWQNNTEANCQEK
jgi:hypothetical protein